MKKTTLLFIFILTCSYNIFGQIHKSDLEKEGFHGAIKQIKFIENIGNTIVKYNKQGMRVSRHVYDTEDKFKFSRDSYYNNKNLITKEEWFDTYDDSKSVIEYTYDNKNNLINKKRYKNGELEHYYKYYYNDQYQMIKKEYYDDILKEIYKFTYDKKGRVKSENREEIRVNKVDKIYSYNENNPLKYQIKIINHKRPHFNYIEYYILNDHGDFLESRTEDINGKITDKVIREYDKNHHLTKEISYYNGRFDYQKNYTYEYDLKGNIINTYINKKLFLSSEIEYY